MRQCGFANVSSSHVSARLSSIVSRPRAHAHSTSGDHVRGTSLMRIGDVAGKWREITVRNVVWRNFGSPGGLAPPFRAREKHALRRSRGNRTTNVSTTSVAAGGSRGNRMRQVGTESFSMHWYMNMQPESYSGLT